MKNLSLLLGGVAWQISGEDAEAEKIISELQGVIQITPTQGASYRRLRVITDNRKAGQSEAITGDVEVCVPPLGDSSAGLNEIFVRLLRPICRDIQANRGLFLHGALAVKEGFGVILAGRSGEGKTTASGRLPIPWRSLCDDVTLVRRDDKGKYWAHPWPTWSKFMEGGPGGSWDISRSIPLKSIFFLAKSDKDLAESVKIEQAVCLLIQVAHQAVSPWCFFEYEKNEDFQAHQLQRFDLICALAEAVPSFILRTSQQGSFWEEMDRALGVERSNGHE